MKTPECLKNKLFLIMIPILITSVISAGTGIYSEIDARLDTVEEKAIQNEKTLAVNNIPELKDYITAEFDSVDNELKEIQMQNVELLRQICRIGQGNC